MGAFKAKQTYRVVIGGILLVIGLINLDDAVDTNFVNESSLITAIILTLIGLVFVLKYFSARRKQPPKG